MGHCTRLVVASLVAVIVAADAFASDLAKEQRWANQIADALLDGEAVYLEDDRSAFLAIETAPAQPTTRAAIVMHGTGVHPDWPAVVHPLRVGLAENGWHTLSIQMPVLANEAVASDYAAIYDWVPGRIDAAVRYLRSRGFSTVVLVAHSQGASMAAYHLGGGYQAVEGFVAIGMSAGIADSPMDTLANLQDLGVPTLDLFGSDDLPGVLASAPERAGIGGHAVAGEYIQQVVEGADHFFDGEEEELLGAVLAWLDRRFP